MVSQLGGGAVNSNSAGMQELESVTKVSGVQAIQDHVHKQAETDRDMPVEEAKKMTVNMNKFLESADTQLRFKFHEELKEYYVTLVDSKTDEVVKEIPSKKLMDMHAEMKKFLGLLIDRKI